MQTGGTTAATSYGKAELARAAGWAAVGAPAFAVGWWLAAALDKAGLNAIWHGGGITLYLEISLAAFVAGAIPAGALAVAVARAGDAGPARAAGFALAAMPWLTVGFNAGLVLFSTSRGLPDGLARFLIWFAGFFAAGAWLTVAGLVLLPAVRTRRAVAWLAGSGTGFAALIGAIGVVDFFGLAETFPYVIAAWCAAYGVAFSLALPRGARNGGAAATPPA